MYQTKCNSYVQKCKISNLMVLLTLYTMIFRRNCAWCINVNKWILLYELSKYSKF